MRHSPHRTQPLTGFTAFVLALSIAAPSPAVVAAIPAPAAAPERDEARIIHALNRLGYGPRPGDVEKIKRTGLDKWLDEQLHPERLADAALAQRLSGLETLSLSTAELIAKYDVPPEARRAIQQERARMAEAGKDADDGGPEMRAARQAILEKYAPNMAGPPRQVLLEAQSAKLLRAVYGERQLEEVLVDFWLNHFNVYADKGPIKMMLGEYEREVIRKHAFGRFEDLLVATAKSPAMLFYLDNWLSVDPKAAERMQQRREQRMQRGRPGRTRGGRFPGRTPGMEMPEGGQPQRPPQPRRTGLNENYAREIMELHTLGVDGGYTQKDVTEVARCFTGWTIRDPRRGEARFAFDERIHDPGDKVVLGRKIKGEGEQEGLAVIHMLATHPKTARFISYKLARRFVSDEPPPALVERAAKTFERTSGDIRAVVAAIVDSPEFWDARHAKVKTPLEFVVSALRASGADVRDARDVARRLGEMGMPLYLQQPPTGYKDTAEAWVSTSGLLARLNFALDLSAGRVRGVGADVASLTPHAPDAAALGDALAAALVPSGLSEKTRQTLAEKAGTSLDPPRVAGLILGSPEFQRR
jgi:uncharacterized protein (DUF1800 family)